MPLIIPVDVGGRATEEEIARRQEQARSQGIDTLPVPSPLQPNMRQNIDTQAQQRQGIVDQTLERQQAAQQPVGVPRETLTIPQSVSGQAPPVQPQEEAGFFDFITGASRETPETQRLSELQSIVNPVSTGNFGSDLRIAAGLLSSLHEEDQLDVIRAADPDASIRRDEKGNAIVTLGSGQEALLNAPGASPADALQITAQVLSFIPAAKIANLGKTALQKMFIGAQMAGATQVGLQEASSALGAENARRPGEVALVAGLGGAAEGVLPAIQAFRGARSAGKLGAAADEIGQVKGSVSEARQAQAGLKQATGVDVPLFQAQQTGVPATLEKQSFIGRLPSGTMKARAALKGQNKAVSSAVDEFLDLIASPESVVTGPEKFRTAAKASIENVKRLRAEKASPIYKESFAEGVNVDLSPVRQALKSRITDAAESGEISNVLKRVTKFISKRGGGDPSLKQLHNAKIEIDQIINKVGEGSVGNTTKNELRGIKDTLLAQMDDASDLYRTARGTFEASSPPVTKLQDSIIGKIADIDDTQLKAVSRRIFDPAETNPQVVRQAKKVITDVDPDAWNELLRTELERRMGAIRSDLANVTTENVPGQLHRAIFGNTKQRAVLRNAVDGDMAKNLNYLETVLKRAGLGRQGGSQTAARQEIMSELKGGAIQSVRDFFKGPISKIASTGEEAAFNSRTKALADALFDPQWNAQMSKIRKLDPNSPAAARAMAQLLKDALPKDEQEQQ